ncbi:two pore calcium channel protein 1-like [Curcuma longa]|uniref:two pore calcium channel protein 1-like n=1 Tax=Curcuma longa TaxID=136217 RepID=UPI003D9F7E46
MQSYSELTGTYWTLVYFISFYLITVLLLLNLVVAFILEAFFAEMDLESANEPNEEMDAPKRKGRRRLTGVTSSRNRTVDILLHRILSAELEESQNAEA